MKKCLEKCISLDLPCPIKECRYWVAYKEDYNCVFDSIEKNGNMTLREVAKRLGVSFVRIKQIEDGAIKKIGHLLKKEPI